ncbi:MAG: hypothetical protein ACTSRI_02700 [Promethearchaeota archaeon]
MSIEWTGWTFFVLSLFAILLFEMFRKAKEKVIIKAYTDIFDKSAEDRKLRSGLKHIGEFKDEFFNEERRCWELRFRNSVSNYFKVYSNLPMINYLKIHFIEKNYFILYGIRAQFYKIKLKKHEQYYKELGWSLQAYCYKLIYFCFSMQASGIILSLAIIGTILMLSMPTEPLAFLIGCIIGLALSIVNEAISRNESVRNSLLKKKKVLVEEETYLVPLVHENEVLDIYEVRGTRDIETDTIDKARGIKNVPLQDNENTDCIIVKGYDELEKLRKNELVHIKSIVQVGIETRKRTPEEMNNYHRSYLAQNRFRSEEAFRLKRENKRIQDEYIKLQKQLQHLRESIDRKVRKALNRMVQEQERKENNIITIYEEIYTAEFLNESFEVAHERVMRRLNDEKMNKSLEMINNIYNTQLKLVKSLENKSNLDFSKINELLNIEINEIESKTIENV